MEAAALSLPVSLSEVARQQAGGASFVPGLISQKHCSPQTKYELSIREFNLEKSFRPQQARLNRDGSFFGRGGKGFLGSTFGEEGYMYTKKASRAPSAGDLILLSPLPSTASGHAQGIARNWGISLGWRKDAAH